MGNKQTNKFWIGPYGVRVPNEKNSIVGFDGVNYINKKGVMTKIFIHKPITKEQWMSKYAEMREDGNYWYNYQ